MTLPSHDGVADQRGIPNLSQLDQPGPAREATLEVGRGADGEAGLADAAGPDQLTGRAAASFLHLKSRR